ncbi:hypothetical protein IE4872_PD01783 (plasmid) [Rhizobium gallicum]|uniref:Uncharacterized protein n=1 Tax=Rhizobium gallicum TaxID=56730 RepID=A0A1L5NWP6_9HYPH|nr:hypothetical protein [Rhizobium gallicum]APO72301.1 hypothetical protein IE4872_PD01783 [Rhizobium gallicum]
MSTMDRVLAKAGVYELRPIEDLPVILSATKFLIGHVLNTRVGEAGLLFALLNRSEQASVPVIRGLKPSMNGGRGSSSAMPPRHPRLLVPIKYQHNQTLMERSGNAPQLPK